MRNYKDNLPEFVNIGGHQWNLPFVDETGFENSDIGFECKSNLLSFYNIEGLKEGITATEVFALSKILLQMAEEMSEKIGGKKLENPQIEDMEFSIRVFNSLKRAGINSKEELQNLTTQDLEKIRNLGERGKQEILRRPDIKLRKE